MNSINTDLATFSSLRTTSAAHVAELKFDNAQDYPATGYPRWMEREWAIVALEVCCTDTDCDCYIPF